MSLSNLNFPPSLTSGRQKLRQLSMDTRSQSRSLAQRDETAHPAMTVSVSKLHFTYYYSILPHSPVSIEWNPKAGADVTLRGHNGDCPGRGCQRFEVDRDGSQPRNQWGIRYGG